MNTNKKEKALQKSYSIIRYFVNILSYSTLLFMALFLKIGFMIIDNHSIYETSNTISIYTFMISYTSFFALFIMALVKWKTMNVYDLMSRIVLLGVIISYDSVLLVLSLIIFIVGALDRFLQIAFDFDLEKWCAMKILNILGVKK